jgi:hypothetical protein
MRLNSNVGIVGKRVVGWNDEMCGRGIGAEKEKFSSDSSLFGQRQGETEGGAVTRVGIGPDPPPVIFEDLLTDGESETRAV